MNELYEQNLSYNSINTARSALSALASCLGISDSIGSNPFIKRFLKGVFETRTPKPKYDHFWDVSKVLDLFLSWKDNDTLSVKDLTLKTCALLLLVTAQRLQTLHTVNLADIEFRESVCVIKITEKIKQTKPGRSAENLTINKFEENTKLCPVLTLSRYIEMTKSHRKRNAKLFICYKKPYGIASKDTLSRWMKTVLRLSGINEFGAHSFRGASSSKLANQGMAIHDILKLGGWSNTGTFQKYYNRSNTSEKQQVKMIQKKQCVMEMFLNKKDNI